MKEYIFPFCHNPTKLFLAEKQHMHHFNGQVDQKIISVLLSFPLSSTDNVHKLLLSVLDIKM